MPLPLSTPARRRLRDRPKRSWRAAVAVVGSVGLLTTALAGMTPASAATFSQATGRFLNAYVGGVQSDPVLALQGATARNQGGAPVTSTTSLDASVLNALQVTAGGINLFGGQGLVTLGAVNQFAQATNTPSSAAASGAITDGGVLSTGNPGAYPSNATVNLTPLLNRLPSGNAILDSAGLTLGALASTAASDGTHDYAIANGGLTLHSPLISALPAALNTQLGAVATATTSLGGANGTMAGAIAAIPPIRTVLTALQASLTGTATVTVDLAPVTQLLTTPLANADRSVVVDVPAGIVTVDLSKLTGLHPAGADTEIVSAATLTQIATQVTTLFDNLVTALGDALETQLDTATVHIDLSAGAPTDLNYVRAQVDGTVAAVQGGTATASATVTSAGAPVTVNGSAVLSAIVAPLNAALFDTPDGALPVVRAGLPAAISDPINNRVLPAVRTLDEIVSLRLNHQSTTGGAFTETAAQLRFVPAATPLAEVDLANSSVGPNPGRPAAPTITSVTPNTGSTAGGQTVTVTGTNFDPDGDGQTFLMTVAVGGAIFSPSSVAADGTSLTFVTRQHTAGPVDVVVTTAGGSATATNAYTYVAPATITSLTPNSGPTTGGQAVTLTGTNLSGATGITVGGLPATNVTVASATQLTFTTPAHAAGAVTVAVTTPAGTTTSTTPIDYTYVAAPTLTTVDPMRGPVAGGQSVTITGTDLAGASSVLFDGVQAQAFTVTSPTQLTATTPAHAAGGVNVTVVTPGGTSAGLPYVYVPAPSAITLDPVAGPVAGGQTVTVTGSGFVAGDTTVSIGGQTVTPTVNSATSLTLLTPAHAAGGVEVRVATSGGTSPASTYTYVAVPTLTGLDPAAGPVAGGQTVTVTGTGFVDGTTVSVDGTPATNVAVDSSTSLTFRTPAHAAGPVDVIVTTPGGSAPDAAYTYLALPTVTSVDPISGPASGGQAVTITGTGFVPGATQVAIGGATLAGADIAVASATSLTLTTPAHAAGPVDVTVTTAGGVSVAVVYTYVAAAPVAPAATAIDPANGPVGGGTTVTLTGTGFVPLSTTVRVGDITLPASTTGSVAGGVVVTSPTSLTFRTPAHAAGPVDVVVITDGGSSAAQTFTYVSAATPIVPSAPRITSPSSGTEGHDAHPVISGTGTPGDAVTVYEGRTVLCRTTVDGAGTWSCRSGAGLRIGTHGIQAVQATPDGAVSARSGTVVLIVSAEPAVITTPTPGGSTTDGSVVAGTGQPGASLAVTEAGTVICTATVAADGTWSCRVDPPLAAGAHDITVTQTYQGHAARGTAAFTVSASPVPAGNGLVFGNGGSTGSGGLAYTGVAVGRLIGLALSLMLLGGLAAALGERRRRA